MGKGFGVNSKAQEGRERKAAQQEMKKRTEEKSKEEKLSKEWQIGAKTKSSKQLTEEQKRLEKAQKKLERDRLEAAESEELSKSAPLKPLPKEKKISLPTRNLTPAQNLTLAQSATPTTSVKSSVTSISSTSRHSEKTGEEKVEYSASNIDDALFLLDASSTSSLTKAGGLERHPERRVKAAYAAFEERELPKLKEEFPGLRLSQLKEKLYRLWQKSADNPLNQAHISYNATKSQEILKTTSDIEATMERLKMPPS